MVSCTIFFHVERFRTSFWVFQLDKAILSLVAKRWRSTLHSRLFRHWDLGIASRRRGVLPMEVLDVVNANGELADGIASPGGADAREATGGRHQTDQPQRSRSTFPSVASASSMLNGSCGRGSHEM